jgi:ribosomal protein L17
MMTTYIVTFEINDATRKSRVKAKLKEFIKYCPIHDNAWAVSTEKKAKEIRDIISPLITGADRIFVIRTGIEAAWQNAYATSNSDWLKKYL